MAEYVFITSRFSSWKEYHLEEEKGGFLHKFRTSFHCSTMSH
jgi:hypothetical protein